MGLFGSSAGKESSCNAGDLDLIPGLGRSHGGGHGNPLQYSCLENPHGQRRLAGYTLWSCKESDMTEQLSTAQYIMSKLLSVCLTISFPFCVQKSILLVCVSIPALQIGSSVPFLLIPYMH